MTMRRNMATMIMDTNMVSAVMAFYRCNYVKFISSWRSCNLDESCGHDHGHDSHDHGHKHGE